MTTGWPSVDRHLADQKLLNIEKDRDNLRAQLAAALEDAKQQRELRIHNEENLTSLDEAHGKLIGEFGALKGELDKANEDLKQEKFLRTEDCRVIRETLSAYESVETELAASEEELSRVNSALVYLAEESFQKQTELDKARGLLRYLWDNCDKTDSDGQFRDAERAAYDYLNPPTGGEKS